MTSEKIVRKISLPVEVNEKVVGIVKKSGISFDDFVAKALFELLISENGVEYLSAEESKDVEKSLSELRDGRYVTLDLTDVNSLKKVLGGE